MAILRITRPAIFMRIKRLPLAHNQVREQPINIALEVLRARMHHQQAAVVAHQINERASLKHRRLGSFNTQRKITNDGASFEVGREGEPISLLDLDWKMILRIERVNTGRN